MMLNTNAIITNEVSPLERISRAMVSSNLKQKETRCDLDYIIALGMVGARNKTASALLAVHLGGSAASAKEARGYVLTLTRRLNTKLYWKLDREALKRVVDAAWKLYLMPVCPKCNGTKYQLIEGTPMLSSRPCPRCHGSGKRAVPILDGDKIARVVYTLNSIEWVAEEEIRRKMR